MIPHSKPRNYISSRDQYLEDLECLNRVNANRTGTNQKDRGKEAQTTDYEGNNEQGKTFYNSYARQEPNRLESLTNNKVGQLAQALQTRGRATESQGAVHDETSKGSRKSNDQIPVASLINPFPQQRRDLGYGYQAAQRIEVKS